MQTQTTLAEAARTYPRQWEARGEDLVVKIDGKEHSLGDIRAPRNGGVRVEVLFASGVQVWMDFPADYPVAVY